MRKNNLRSLGILTTALLAGFGRVSFALAQYPGDASGGDIRQTVARVSYLTGPVSYARGDAPDDWQPPDMNVPLTLGDRLYTGRGGRVELQIHGGTTVRLDAETDLAALNLTDDTKQFSQTLGAATFQVRRLGPEEIFEVDTPNAAITFDAPGDYRVDVDGDGNTRVSVHNGRVLVASGGGQVTLKSGDEMDIQGVDRPQYDVYALAGADAFDRWVSTREARSQKARSRQYVSDDIVGVDDLDDTGRWEDIPEYGRAWSPVSVSADWAPYRVGHWCWQDPWGWTWISAEPWGWAPYHYGRWVTYSSRWYWVPVGRTVRTVSYSPALVAFVGGGPGFSTTVAIGGGSLVGWFPLGPRDPFDPWWGRRSAVRPGNVTYVNRSYVTVVNQNTFVSGGLVSRGWVRDQAVIRQVGGAPVLRGPLPFLPTQGSLRVAVRTNLPAAPRPPSIVLSRPVVARVAPPPAPPAFAAKLDVIRQNRGAPVDSGMAARIVQQRGRPDPVTSIRPVAPANGGVTLSQGARREGRGAPASAPAPVQPVAPVRGRPLATVERPVFAPAPGPAPGANPAPGNNPSNPPPPGDDRSSRGRTRVVNPPPGPSGPPVKAPTPRNDNPRNRQLPRTDAAPAAVTPADQPPPDHRRRVIERQPPLTQAPPPQAAAPPRERAVAPPPTAAPANAAPADNSRRQPVGRPQRPTQPRPQPQQATPVPPQAESGRVAAPPPPAPDQSGRGRERQIERRAPSDAPPPQAPAPQANPPQERGRPPAQAEPKPEAGKQKAEKPAPAAKGRGRGNAEKPTPEKKPD